MATTMKANMIIPEVLADYVESKLTDKSVFAPLADIDTTLVGQGGDTITFPKYAYIGKADVTNENGQIIPVALNTSSVKKTVHKLTKAVQITDEARMSAYGDPMAEAAAQLAKAIDDKTDDEFLAEMEGATLVVGNLTPISSDNIIDALAAFGEDEDGAKALILSPTDLATLRKDDDYINKSDIATDILIRGASGMLWGCQLINTNRLKPGASATHRDCYIVKPGALALILKRGVMVETEREPDYQRDTVYASKHYVPYLKDESKIIRVIYYTDLEQVTSGITSTAGTASNKTFLHIDEVAPVNMKWVYKLGSSDVTPTFGTAVSSYTDWVRGTEISASTNTKASVVLVDAATNKPVKYANITLVKGE